MRLRINKVGLEADFFTHLKRPDKYVFPNQEENEYAHGILFFCPHCGTEFYAEWRFMSLSCPLDDRYDRAWFARNPPGSATVERQRLNAACDTRDLIDKMESAYRDSCAAEAEQIREMQNCPVCSGKLRKDFGFSFELGESFGGGDYYERVFDAYQKEYWGYDRKTHKFKSEFFEQRAEKWEDISYRYLSVPQCKVSEFPLALERGYEHMKDERKRYHQETANKLIQERIELFDLPVFEMLSEEKCDAIKSTPNTLKTFVHNLIKLENDIYSLTKRLEQLYAMRMDNEYAVLQEQHMSVGAQEVLQAIIDAEALYTAQYSELERVKLTPPPKEVTIRLPDYPVSPTLAAPGLFNKKKVQAENEKLLAAYEAEMKAYQQEVEVCEREKERQEAENRNALERMIAEAEEKARAAKATLEEVKASAKQRIAAAGDAPGPAKAFAQITEDEIREAEELLKNLYATRNKLYGYDIVFGKYRDVVALSSFYEYLMAGRCDSLEGAHGAYNIYESEIRANQVIAQLSAVLVSLEKIQKNQYMVYTELKGIHSSLNRLNDTMGQALQSIQSIKANTDSMTDYMATIAQNSHVIAHNTAKTAYYAKINAELTNSLGFMRALS